MTTELPELSVNEAKLMARWESLIAQLKLQRFILYDQSYRKSFPKAYRDWKARQTEIETELGRLYTLTKNHVVKTYNKGKVHGSGN